MAKESKRTTPGTLANDRINKRESAVLSNAAVQCLTVLYDFDQDGGAQGDFDFEQQLPEGSYVTACYADAQDAATSAGTPAVKITAGGTDLTSAEDPTAWGNSTNQLTLDDAGGVKASGAVKMNLATADLTAGKIRFAIYFHTSK